MKRTIVESVSDPFSDIIASILGVDPGLHDLVEHLPVGPEDHVVGVLDENLIRLDILRNETTKTYEKRLGEITEEMHAIGREHQAMHRRGEAHDVSVCEAFHKRCDQFEEEVDFMHTNLHNLRDAFYALVRLQFSKQIGNKESVGIREGYQVVWTEVSEQPQQREQSTGIPIELLSDLFGDLPRA